MHQGVCKMKALARSYIWWPGIDMDIESKVRGCNICQVNRKLPASSLLHPWEFPQKPWSRIHLDYAGPFLGKMFLIVVDAYSKWLDALSMNSSTSSATIEKLRRIFSEHGLPNQCVTDNGTCFTSSEFQQFMKVNGIKHTFSAPYHPSSDGQAERSVQTFKEAMRKITNGDIETRVYRMLLHYRTTPHTTTGLSPAEILMNRKLATRK